MSLGGFGDLPNNDNTLMLFIHYFVICFNFSRCYFIYIIHNNLVLEQLFRINYRININKVGQSAHYFLEV